MLGLVEFGSGLTPIQLRVMLVTWIMNGIHFGAVGAYPVETLIVLAITLSPMFDKFFALYPAAHTPINSKSPSSPSSGPQPSESTAPTAKRVIVKAGANELPLFYAEATAADTQQDGLDSMATLLVKGFCSVCTLSYLL